jgi:hypothetical protein
MKKNLSFENIFKNYNGSFYINKNRSFQSFKIFDSSVVTVPKLTICIPTFNRPDRILHLLELFNSYEINSNDFLILICDNNPRNKTNQPSIVSSLNKFKLQIQYYINESNVGMFENWNRSIFLSPSEWVTLLHDDDLLNINFFLQYNELIKRFSKYNLIINSFKILNKKDLDTRELYKIQKPNFKYKFIKPFDNYLIGSNIYGAPTCGVLINKVFFEKNGGFIVNDSIYPANDHFSLFYLNLKSTFIKVDDSFGYYILGDNLSLDKAVSIKTAKLNYQFRKYLSDLYIKNKFLSKLILEGANDNLLQMITNGPFSYHFNDIYELRVLQVILPNKFNLFLYKLICKIYKLFKLIHFL